MDGRIVWLFSLLCFTGAAVQMTGPSTYEARVGSIAHIPCTFTADTLPADPRYFAVFWYFKGKLILRYDNIVIPTDPRYSLDVDRALNGNADLYISNTFLSDGGVYKCSVTNSPIQVEKNIKVEISGGALQMTGPSTYEAKVGSIAHIPCTFRADNLPADPKYFAVFWNLEGNRILTYHNTVIPTDPRYSLDKDRALNGTANLTISDTSVLDAGVYTCTVNYSSFPIERKIRVNISARPLISILNKSVQRNTENTLTCMANGYFPNNINVTWYKDGEVLKNQLMGKPLQYDNGTYQVNSTVTITPIDDDRNKTFSCRIQHVSLQGPLQEDFQLTYQGVKNQEFQSESSSHLVIIIIGIAIAVVVIIAIIAAVYLWRRKTQRKGFFTIMDIEGPTKLIAGEETSLYCKATNCPKNTSVTWLEKRRGQDYEIPEYHGGDNEEEERLMDTQYGVISCREGPNFTSSLKFRPSVTNHKDVTFICRYSCGEEKKEKTFHCGAIYAKPQLVQPISRSLIVSGVLKYLVILENFYPRNITIRWTQGIGEPQEALSSTETITDIPDGTPNVYSEVTIPEELLKDPEFRVRVTWEHESLDTPGYKDLSIRDPEYQWTPLVEEIQTPNIFHNTPVTLQCHISEYFPDDITVTWLRKNKNQEICEETDNMVSKTITPRREVGNTYSCTASLTIVPTLSVHQGAEYICRVDHPSLERPIERRTESLIVKDLPWRPQVGDIIIPDLEEDKEACLTCDISGYFPDHLKVIWYKKEPGTDSHPIVMELPKDDYKVSNKTKEGKDKTFSHKSLLTFTPSFSRDQGAEFICKVEHPSLKKPINRRTGPIRIDLPRPQVKEIKIPKLEEDKEASLTCDISGYFPDYTTVSWFRKLSRTDLHPIIAPNDVFQICTEQKSENIWQSSLTFTPSFSRDQGAEFICRVEHPSLEKPIERRTDPITIDLPRPQVKEIKIPKLEENKEAILTCDISGYFPDYTTVSWYRKLSRTDLQPIIAPNDVFQICTEQIREKIWQSSLTFTPSFSRDKGSEFICRVEHPGMEKPIEKTTGPIKLSKHSMNGTVNAQHNASS